MAPESNGRSGAQLLGIGAKVGVKLVLNLVTANTNVIVSVAAFAYEAETDKKWEQASAGDRALWQTRVQNMLRGLAGIIS